MKRLLFLIPMLLLLFGCSREVRTQYYMMDTVMTFALYGDTAQEAERALSDRIAALENVFSPTREESELVAVNRAAGTPVQVSPDFAELLGRSLAANAETNGAFDPTLGGVIELWQRETVPAERELSQTVHGCEYVKLSGETVQTAPGLKLNFGAVAKGYASDCAKRILEEYHVENALLSLGGNLYAKGTRKDGNPWLVGVRDPNGTQEEWLGTLPVRDAFLIASGDYERFFEEDGVRYHHILDPNTAYPAQSDLRETVVVCDDGTRGDILSTALFVMGSEDAVTYWRTQGGFDMILVRKDNTVLVTSGIAEEFTLTAEGYSLEVVE